MAKWLVHPTTNRVRRSRIIGSNPLWNSKLFFCFLWWLFLGVVETIVGLLLCCSVSTVQCISNVLYYVISASIPNSKKLPLWLDLEPRANGRIIVG